MHTVPNCPLRSMLWISTNEDNIIIEATDEMIQLLEYNPINQSIDTIWSYSPTNTNIPYTTVITHNNSRTLSLCSHPYNGGHTIVCSDVTDLRIMQHEHQDLSILRLSTYGTIEAVFPNQGLPLCTSWVGQPMMRYIHSDDVQKFCAGISRASRLSCLVQLNVHFENGEPFEWSFMSVEHGKKLICFIRPPSLLDKTHFISNHSVHHIVTQAQCNFWKFLEKGLNWLSYSLAHGLLLLVETLWGVIHYDHSLHSYIKKRPEIDLVCNWITYIGISHQTSKALVDHYVDKTLYWITRDKQDLIV